MKKWLILLCGCLAFMACDNELDLLETYQDIPIVYGILSAIDTAQYVRLEKAFVDESISALELAQNPDSLYYDQAAVFIRRVSTGISYELSRVDGTNEGFIRQDGVFATEPNFLYKIRTNEIPLETGEEYVLEIFRNGSETPDTASTTIIGQPRIQQPNAFGNVTFDFMQPTSFQWVVGQGNSIFDINVDVHYKERNAIVGGDFEDKTITWNVISNISLPTGTSQVVEHDVNGEQFYSFLRSNLEQNPDISRKLLNIDVSVTAGGSEIADFIAIGQANLGITSSQDIPTFTNISTGRGIFSASNQFVNAGLNLSPRSLDSLYNSQLTEVLNFEP